MKWLDFKDDGLMIEGLHLSTLLQKQSFERWEWAYNQTIRTEFWNINLDNRNILDRAVDN
jgi:hypothetical protein